MSLVYAEQARLDQLDQIMPIIDEAKKYLKENGSSQWQSGYPDRTAIAQDIAQGNGYVLMVDRGVAGYAAVITGSEPSYQKIDGAWSNDQNVYATIHRLCLSSRLRGLHLAGRFMSILISLKVAEGVRNFRIDTFKLNVPMQKTALSSGFVRRGIIQVADPIDPDRLAYELNI